MAAFHVSAFAPTEIRFAVSAASTSAGLASVKTPEMAFRSSLRREQEHAGGNGDRDQPGAQCQAAARVDVLSQL